MNIMESMMGMMMNRMSKEDKEAMMDGMMEKFFADMTADDKGKMMDQMMPKMMEGMDMKEMMPKMMMGMIGCEEGEGGMMGMMSGMQGGDKEGGMSMMPQMMTEMMPQCLTMMLPKLPKEERIEFASKLVSVLVQKGSVGMSEEEKKAYREQLAGRVQV